MVYPKSSINSIAAAFAKISIPKVRAPWPKLSAGWLVTPIRVIAPNDFIGGIKLWIDDNYRSQFKITVGVGGVGISGNGGLWQSTIDIDNRLFGDPGRGKIKLEFTCRDLSFPISRQPTPMISASLCIECWEEHLEIEEFSAIYADPEFFDKLEVVLNWVLLGFSINDLMHDRWSAWCYAFCNTMPLHVLEKVSLLRRSLASSWKMLVIKCRGPPQCQAGTWHDNVPWHRLASVI